MYCHLEYVGVVSRLASEDTYGHVCLLACTARHSHLENTSLAYWLLLAQQTMPKYSISGYPFISYCTVRHSHIYHQLIVWMSVLGVNSVQYWPRTIFKSVTNNVCSSYACHSLCKDITKNPRCPQFERNIFIWNVACEHWRSIWKGFSCFIVLSKKQL